MAQLSRSGMTGTSPPHSRARTGGWTLTPRRLGTTRCALASTTLRTLSDLTRAPGLFRQFVSASKRVARAGHWLCGLPHHSWSVLVQRTVRTRGEHSQESRLCQSTVVRTRLMTSRSWVSEAFAMQRGHGRLRWSARRRSSALTFDSVPMVCR
eukprot:195156-Pyramimonas_sp.AAC.1